MDLKFEKFFTDYSMDMKLIIGKLTNDKDQTYIEDKLNKKNNSSYAIDDEFIYFEAYEENYETESENEYPVNFETSADSNVEDNNQQISLKKAPKSNYSEKIRRCNKMPRYIRIKKNSHFTLNKLKAKHKRAPNITDKVTSNNSTEDIQHLSENKSLDPHILVNNESQQCSIIIDEHDSETAVTQVVIDSDTNSVAIVN